MNAPLYGQKSLFALDEADSPRTLADDFAGKHLLVTGVTGFLGKVWMAMVLDRLPEVRKITVLARGQKKRSAAERFHQIYTCSPAFRPLREKHGVELHALVAEKVAVVDVKLSEPLCGLDESEAKRLMADVDCVVHFAGLTDFEPDPLHAIDANILGAQHVADLAALSPSRRYLHCSTCFVAGMVQGDIAERVTPGLGPTGVSFDRQGELRALLTTMAECSSKRERVDAAMEHGKRLGWPNIYTFTKGLSEHLLESRTDLDQTTIRPAIVECAREYPFVGWNEGVNTSGPLVWLLSTTFRRFPAKAGNIFDVVPVDTVARATVLAAAALMRGEAKSVYQVASGDINPMNFERALELSALANRRRCRDLDDFFEREITPHFDGICVDPDHKVVFGIPEMRRLAQAMRGKLREIDLSRDLPRRIYDKRGPELDEKLSSLSMKFRMSDRRMSTIEEMLRQYRPFVHDYNYRFLTGNLVEATAALCEADRELFGFDVATINWRHYWLEVQVPGLDKWSTPILRGEKVYDDPPLAPAPEPLESFERSSISVVA